MNPLPPNPLLEQFLSESRDLLEITGKKLMQLEDAPTDQGILNELFRCVHTLKGNSGLFTFPEMTRVLHGGEDLLRAGGPLVGSDGLCWTAFGRNRDDGKDRCFTRSGIAALGGGFEEADAEPDIERGRGR
jgi:HPt (histidine-containing phosphotransfer) domain-containing protein